MAVEDLRKRTDPSASATLPPRWIDVLLPERSCELSSVRQLGAPEAKVPLLRVLRDSAGSINLRAAAIAALGNIRDTTVTAALLPMLGEPHTAHEGFVLYRQDCRKVLSALRQADLGIDLTLTSPPYNIGKPYEGLAHHQKALEIFEGDGDAAVTSARGL